VGFLFYNIFINKNIMKKIIRLTESQLTRLIKRVVNESANGNGTKDNPYKIKYFDTEQEKQSGQRSGNIDIYDLHLSNDVVRFSYSFAGENYVKSHGSQYYKDGIFHCDRNTFMVGQKGHRKMDGGMPLMHYKEKFVSDDGIKVFQKVCDEYVSTGSKQQNMV
jgi:hypothetical protein